MKVICYCCGASYNVKKEHGGKIVSCKKCKARIKIPVPPISKTKEIIKTKICPMCKETILKDAKKCRFCKEILNKKEKQKINKPKKEKKWYEKTWVTLTVLFVLIILIFGKIHIVRSSDITLPRILIKHNFGYNETFINVDIITGMPYILAKTRYPLSCIILAEHEYIESDYQFERRARKEFEEEFEEEYNKLMQGIEK